MRLLFPLLLVLFSLGLSMGNEMRSCCAVASHHHLKNTDPAMYEKIMVPETKDAVEYTVEVLSDGYMTCPFAGCSHFPSACPQPPPCPPPPPPLSCPLIPQWSNLEIALICLSAFQFCLACLNADKKKIWRETKALFGKLRSAKTAKEVETAFEEGREALLAGDSQVVPSREVLIQASEKGEKRNTLVRCDTQLDETKNEESKSEVQSLMAKLETRRSSSENSSYVPIYPDLKHGRVRSTPMEYHQDSTYPPPLLNELSAIEPRMYGQMDQSVNMSMESRGYGDELVDAYRKDRHRIMRSSRPARERESEYGDAVLLPDRGERDARSAYEHGLMMHPQYGYCPSGRYSLDRHSPMGMSYAMDPYEISRRPHSTYDHAAHMRFASSGRGMEYDAYEYASNGAVGEEGVRKLPDESDSEMRRISHNASVEGEEVKEEGEEEKEKEEKEKEEEETADLGGCHENAAFIDDDESIEKGKEEVEIKGTTWWQRMNPFK